MRLNYLLFEVVSKLGDTETFQLMRACVYKCVCVTAINAEVFQVIESGLPYLRPSGHQ